MGSPRLGAPLNELSAALSATWGVPPPASDAPLHEAGGEAGGEAASAAAASAGAAASAAAGAAVSAAGASAAEDAAAAAVAACEGMRRMACSKVEIMCLLGEEDRRENV